MQHFYLSDLDKTLLRSDLSLGDYSRSVWSGCVERGARLSVATARSLTGVRKLLAGLELREPLILLDGAVIASIDGRLHHVAALDRELGEAVMAIGRRTLGAEPLLVGMEPDGRERFVYPRCPNPWQEALRETMHSDRRIYAAEPMEAMERNLKIVYLQSEAETALLEAALRRELGKTVEIKRSADPYIDCWFMTVLHPEGDKAHALARLEELEGVDRQHTTVFGDSHNDLGLFAMAGHKVAVANAIEALKERADIVLPWTNDEEAVARFLERSLLDRGRDY